MQLKEERKLNLQKLIKEVINVSTRSFGQPIFEEYKSAGIDSKFIHDYLVAKSKLSEKQSAKDKILDHVRTLEQSYLTERTKILINLLKPT